jgi:hypothetical protein
MYLTEGHKTPYLTGVCVPAPGVVRKVRQTLQLPLYITEYEIEWEL